VVGVDVMGRFDVGGWGGGLVWFGLVWNEDLGKGQGIENSINYKAYYNKVYKFYYKYIKYMPSTANWRRGLIFSG
jgi:hypothetical protein